MVTSSNGNISCVTGPLWGQWHGQWHGALTFSLICAWTNGWANNRDTGDLMPSRSLWRHCNAFLTRFIFSFYSGLNRSSYRYTYMYIFVYILRSKYMSIWPWSLKCSRMDVKTFLRFPYRILGDDVVRSEAREGFFATFGELSKWVFLRL